MGLWFGLDVDGKQVDFLSLSYSNEWEIDVLETLFPATYWSDTNPEAENWYTHNPDATGDPPAFDFIANEEKAKEAMRVYSGKATWENTRALSELQDEFVEGFWRVYNAGLALQRQGKVPRVSIG